MPRLFVALDPPRPVCEALAGLQPEVPGARWTPPEKMHLTLHFLGDVPETDVAPPEWALSEVQGRAFPLAVEGLDAFPNRRSARVLVAQVSLPQGLALLHGQVGAALERAGFTLERRPFRPHLTLARFKGADRRDVRAFLAQPVAALSFEAEAFHLYRSERHPEGARYARLHSYELA